MLWIDERSCYRHQTVQRIGIAQQVLACRPMNDAPALQHDRLAGELQRELRMLLDDDGADWRERPVTLPAERINAFNSRAGQSEQLVGRTIFAAGFTWAGVLCWDDIRTVDYLCSRADVDPERIGCVGLSVGGLRTVYLTALDERR